MSENESPKEAAIEWCIAIILSGGFALMCWLVVKVLDAITLQG